jgi:hypothetical protein
VSDRRPVHHHLDRQRERIGRRRRARRRLDHDLQVAHRQAGERKAPRERGDEQRLERDLLGDDAHVLVLVAQPGDQHGAGEIAARIGDLQRAAGGGGDLSGEPDDRVLALRKPRGGEPDADHGEREQRDGGPEEPAQHQNVSPNEKWILNSFVSWP